MSFPEAGSPKKLPNALAPINLGDDIWKRNLKTVIVNVVRPGDLRDTVADEIRTLFLGAVIADDVL